MIEMLGEWFSGPIAQAWGSTLLHFVWQGVAIAAICELHLWILRNRSASSRYLCACGWFALLAAAPLVTYGWLLMQSLPLSDTITSLSAPLDTLAPTEPTGISVSADHLAPALGPRWAFFQTVDGWIPWLIAGWGTGVIALSIRLIIAGCALRWLRRDIKPVPIELADGIAELRNRLRIPSRVIVGVSSNIASAIAFGIVRPIVLIPTSWLLDLSPSMLHAVVAHELAHIRRHDLWVNLFQRIIETIWFYHPAAWWISSVIRRERETCCDELAVAVTDGRVEYARTLEHLAARRLTGTTLGWLTAGMGGNRMALLQRVQHILGTEKRDGAGSVWPVVVVMVSLAFGALILFRSESIALADEQSATAESSSSEENGQATNDIEELKRHLMATEQALKTAVERLTELTNENARLRDQLQSAVREPLPSKQPLYESSLPESVPPEVAEELEELQRQEKLIDAKLMLYEQRQALALKLQELKRLEARAKMPSQNRAVGLDAERERIALQRDHLMQRLEALKQRHREKLDVLINAEVGRRQRDLEIQRERLALEAEREALERDREIRQHNTEMERLKHRARNASDDEKAEIEREIAILEFEIQAIEADRNLAQRARELEFRAHESEENPDAIRQQLELEAKQELMDEAAELEAQLQDLELKMQRVERELDRQRKTKADEKGR